MRTLRPRPLWEVQPPTLLPCGVLLELAGLLPVPTVATTLLDILVAMATVGLVVRVAVVAAVVGVLGVVPGWWW